LDHLSFARWADSHSGEARELRPGPVVFPGTFLSTVLGCGSGAEATEWSSNKAPPAIAASTAIAARIMSVVLGMQGKSLYGPLVSDK